ncbi:MAG: M61 family metallopeptidase [Bacteroidetes bacterium]|nr:M61 family metallopeptidase [Bacteroidota bacterium]
MKKFSIEQQDKDLIGTSAFIRYHLFFDRAPQHILRVEMEIDKITHETITLVMPAWMPGSYKIREMVAHQGNVVITTNDGKLLQWHWTSKNRIEVQLYGATSIRLSYTYFANERGVRTSHVNRFHAYLMPVACLMYAEGREDEIHHLYFHHNRTNWKTLTSSLSPVKSNFEEDEPIILGALNYDIVADSPIDIGNHSVRKFDVFGKKHELAIMGNQDVDIEWLANEVKRIVEVECAFWGDLPYDRYIFMLLVGEGQRGGLEHARCNVSAVEPSAFSDKATAQGMLTLLVHEYFHTWNIKRIRPNELGPFDYSKENYSRMLWLAEGVTSYYDDYLTYRCGFLSKDEYLQTISQQHLARLERVPGRFAMSVRDSSYLAWVKLYSLSPDMNNRFPSYYLKGGIIAMMLDLYIIAQSNGTKRLEDGMKMLWELYKTRPEHGVTEEEVITAIEFATGIKVRSILFDWLDGTTELPYNEIFAPFGLTWGVKKEVQDTDTFGDGRFFASKNKSVFIGLSLKEEQGKVLVREVEDGTPAEVAGLGIDDEILCVNTKRVSSVNSFQQLISAVGAGNTALITALCDGTLYETTVIPKEVVNKSLMYVQDISNDQRRLLNFWLSLM